MDRRELLRRAAAASLVMPASRLVQTLAQDARPKLPVAAVVTEYTENSHADVIVGKILEGFEHRGGAGPALRLVSLYVDQTPARDLSRGLAEKHGFRIAPTIDEALTGGTDRLQVAGVLSIGEHGQYPFTSDTNQHEYPRRRFFDEIVACFRRVEAVAPVFNDKHLAHRWEDAQHMYHTAVTMQIPFMAGSSLPVTWREPPLTLPLECQIESALCVGYGGLESYGFHALETLQCMVERRAGGESGVTSVQSLQGDAIAEARDRREWSEELLAAALATMPDVTPGPWKETLRREAAFYQIRYRDGLTATVAMANGAARHFAFAAKLRGQPQPVATWFKLQDEKPFGHFGYLVRAIEQMVHTGRPSYPVERTLLTTGILDRVMHSLAEGGSVQQTPELALSYPPVDWPFAGAR